MKALMIFGNSGMLQSMSLSFGLHWPEAILVTTSEGDRGAEMVATDSPDVVLMDLMLPDMSGFELLSRICEFSGVPVVVIVSKGEEEDGIKALNMGAANYMVKPLDYVELWAWVRAAVRRASRDDVSQCESFSGSGDLALAASPAR